MILFLNIVSKNATMEISMDNLRGKIKIIY
jgi:hypothetical protein